MRRSRTSIVMIRVRLDLIVVQIEAGTEAAAEEGLAAEAAVDAGGVAVVRAVADTVAAADAADQGTRFPMS